MVITYLPATLTSVDRQRSIGYCMFPIQADDTTGLWQNQQKHYFLINHFDEALKIKERLNELPETSLTFSKDRLNISSQVPDGLFYMLDAWRISDAYSNDSRFINPHAEGTTHLSPVFTRCGCGRLIRTGEGRNVSGSDHAEGCRPYWRLEAYGRFERRRAAALRTLLRLYREPGQYYEMFGYKHNMRSNIFDVYQIDRDAEYEAGRRMMGKTAEVLLKEYKPDVIADFYDVGRKAIYPAVEEYGDTSVKELYKIRQS